MRLIKVWVCLLVVIRYIILLLVLNLQKGLDLATTTTGILPDSGLHLTLICNDLHKFPFISNINKQHISSVLVSIQQYIYTFNVRLFGPIKYMFKPHIYTFRNKILTTLIQTDNKRIKVFTSSRPFSTWSNICVHSFCRCFCGIICTWKSWKIKRYNTYRATRCQSLLVISSQMYNSVQNSSSQKKTFVRILYTFKKETGVHDVYNAVMK